MAELTALGFGSVHEVVPVYYQHAHTDDFALREIGPNPTWLQIVTQEVPQAAARRLDGRGRQRFPGAGSLRRCGHRSRTGGRLRHRLAGTASGRDGGWRTGRSRSRADPPDRAPGGSALVEGADDDKPFVLTLLDGRLLSLPMSRIRPTLQALLELWAGGGIDADTRQDRVQPPGCRGPGWAGGTQRPGLARRRSLTGPWAVLRQSGGIPKAEVPESFLATLRPYQTQGVDWLQFLASAGLGGVLADDMGLGKTVQTLAHLMIEKAAGRLDRPSLIVCPTSLIPNWTAEARRFAPELSVLALHGAARKASFSAIPKHDLVLSTYPLLTRDADILLAQEWHAVILDEAQSIKNPNAETTRQALRLKARQRLCLSGTPLQNHLGELWSLFDFLAPGFLGGQKSFKSRYRTPIEKHGDVERQDLAQSPHPPVHAAPDQRRSHYRTAAEDRDRRAGRDGNQSARDLRGDPPVDARQGAGCHRAERPRAVWHHHPGRAVEDAPGVLRPQAAEIEDGGKIQGRIGETGPADGDAQDHVRRGPPCPAVLPVHRNAGADRGPFAGR